MMPVPLNVTHYTITTLDPEEPIFLIFLRLKSGGEHIKNVQKKRRETRFSGKISALG
jgi:hypothetical protein